MRLLTVKEFAAEIGAAESTVRAKCASGEWYSIKIGKGWKIDTDRVYQQINQAIINRKEKTIPKDTVEESTLIKLRKQNILEGVLCIQKSF